MTNNLEIIQWAKDYLVSHGYILSGSPQDVQITPWSCVIRFVTSKGNIYLKQTPPGLSLEPVITKILNDRFHVNVPVILGSNQKLNCFLMEDAGEPLREIFKHNFDVR